MLGEELAASDGEGEVEMGCEVEQRDSLGARVRAGGERCPLREVGSARLRFLGLVPQN